MSPLFAEDAIQNPQALIVWGTVIVVAVVAWFAPVGIALARHHPNTAAILVVNLFLGWTCVGWVVALAWSFTAVDPPLPRELRERFYDD